MTRFVRGVSLSLWLATAVLFSAAPSWSGGKAGGLTKDQEKQLSDTLRDVINKGAKLFNDQGDYPACYRLYEGAALTVRPLLGQYPGLQGKIDSALSEANAHPSVVQKAFLVRKALDEIRKQLGGVETVPTPVEPKDATFTITTGPGEVKVKQGGKTDVKITVKRGKAFKGEIKVEVKGGPGIQGAETTLPEQPAGTENFALVTLMAAKDAAPGKVPVTVTATGGGKKVTTTFQATVEKAAVQPPPSAKASISGMVTLDGKPLPGGSVGFVPTDTKAAIKLHLAILKNDGTYSFPEGEVPPGSYMVGVGPPEKLPPGAPKIEIPKKYQAAINSPLTYTVKPGAQTFDIKLQSDKKPVDPPPPPATVSVTGKVTFKGKPLAGGQVHFFASDGKKSGVATINAEGTYSLDKGLIAGTYQVAITSGPGQPKTAIPEKYQFYSTSALKLDVKPGANQFNINLQ